MLFIPLYIFAMTQIRSKDYLDLLSSGDFQAFTQVVFNSLGTINQAHLKGRELEDSPKAEGVYYYVKGLTRACTYAKLILQVAGLVENTAEGMC